MSEETLFDVAIIGGGPGGLAAAIYTCRSRLQTLLIDSMGGGGQLNIIDHIENYPGVVPQSGLDLATHMRAQAEGFGATVTFDEIAKVSPEGELFRIQGASGSFLARTLIVASGARHKELCIPSEERLKGRGVSYCATCDGNFFKDQRVVVVGGGDTAVKDAIYLSRLVRKLTLVHRRDKLRAEKLLADKLIEKTRGGNVTIEWNHVLDEVLGDDSGVTGMRLRHTSGSTKELAVHGVFIAIGHTPNTQLFAGQLEMDNGYLRTLCGSEGNATATSIPGIFAAGDVQDMHYRQAITSAGTGCMAAKDAERYLDMLK